MTTLSKRAKATLRRGRRQRGAAAVEAVVSLPIFVLMFGGTIFMGQLYREKLQTWEKSRAATWEKAGFGCPRPGAGQGQQLDPAANISLFDTNSLAANSPGVALCDASFAYWRVPVEGQTTVAGTNFSANVSSSFTVACNEPAQAGDFYGGVSYLWNALRQSLEPIPEGGAPPLDPPPPSSVVYEDYGELVYGPYGYEMYY